jgi:uncharacterized caspase-like protein
MAQNDHAIVVGIDRYPELKSLQGPVKDAEAFRDWLTENAAVPVANVAMVLSPKAKQVDARPVQEEVDAAFNELFKKVKAKPARRLYFYFAGHGCSQGTNHLALLMANANLDLLNRSMCAPDYHEGLARRPLFKEHLIFYDCCRNYDRRVTGRRPEWSDVEPGAGAADVKQFIMYGAAFTQYANEREVHNDRRGLFTTALLEGLKGKAPTQVGDKWVVTTNSLRTYVASRLQELAKAFDLEQLASLGPGSAEDIVIAEVTPTLLVVTVKGPADGTEIVVSDHQSNEVRRGTVANGQVVFELEPGLYQFAHAVGLARGVLRNIGPGQSLVVEIAP